MKHNSEASDLFSEVKKFRRLAKHTAIIAVGSRKALQIIGKRHGPVVFKPAWHERLAFWKRADNFAPVQFTTVGNLPNTIEAFEHSCKKGGYRNMLVLVAESISRITINVGPEIDKLCVARTPYSRLPLFVSSSSTLADVALQEYHGQVPGGREVICGKGVRLEVDPAGSLAWRFDPSSVRGMRGRDIQDSLCEMENSGNNPIGWKNWKLPVSCLINLLGDGFDGSAKVTVTPKGFCLTYKTLSISPNWVSGFGTALAASGVNLPLAGAILLAVYFIPWDSFFQWLGNTLWTLWSWLVDFCSKLVILAANFLDIQRGSKPSSKTRRLAAS
ncbi:unnamed protein product [Clonostachys solani]|uniref:Uncharacterized protein n=1 Tax=Clonostachys solani TaxID=160281 RepID=A0A9P0EB87_9HYPO|nr:unnamed protein product [Clonostachys solani]